MTPPPLTETIKTILTLWPGAKALVTTQDKAIIEKMKRGGVKGIHRNKPHNQPGVDDDWGF